MAQTSIEGASRCRLAVGAELVGQLQEYKEKAWHGHQRSLQQPAGEVKSLEDPERPQVPGLEDVLRRVLREGVRWRRKVPAACRGPSRLERLFSLRSQSEWLSVLGRFASLKWLMLSQKR